MSAADEFGTLERVGDVSILRYERRLSHPPQRVWLALTEEAELAAWFPTTIEGLRHAGVPLHFSFRRGEAPSFDGEMLACVAPSLLEFRWSDDVLRFELEPDGADGADGAGTILRLMVTFPQHGKAARDAAGWHVCLEQLVALCDGVPVGSEPTASGRWQVVHQVYVKRFGPEASVIGPPEGFEST